MLELSENAYGHNLVKILAAAESKGLSIQVTLTPEQRAEVTKAATYYAGKVFEYPAISEAVGGYPSLPRIDVLLEAANSLVESLAQPCKESP